MVSTQETLNSDSEAHETPPRTILAGAETQSVLRLRLVLLAGLLASTLAISVVVYVITNRSDNSLFRGEYEGIAAEILSSFQHIVDQKLSAISSLGVTFTSFARSQNAQWPNVTINDYQERAAIARRLSDSLLLEILPIVTDETREGWEAYAEENNFWIEEGRKYQGRTISTRNSTDQGVRKTQSIELGFSRDIFVYDENLSFVPDPNPGPYFPIWQSSPVLDLDLINYNLNFVPEYRPFLQKSAELGEISMGRVNVAPPGYPGDAKDDFTTFFANLLTLDAGGTSPVFYNGDPMSNVWFPVFDNHNSDSHKVVAVMLAVIHWSKFFEGVLRPGSKAVTMILEDSCGGPFTYEIDGDGVYFIGKGDLHDQRYSSFVKVEEFNTLLRTEKAGSVGVKVNQEICAYKMRVYPTKAFYDEYNTSIPLLVTGAVVGAFAITALLFLLYDRLVQRRQKLVMSTAVRSSAIVTSLFPAGFGDRLIQEGETNGYYLSRSHRITRFLGTRSRGSGTGQPVEDEVPLLIEDEEPLADLFPNCTVLFADIVEFTSWSSTRDPAQVFILLQAVYRSFDAIAAQMNVFKVETIGEEQPDHAVRMCSFAQKASLKMREVAQALHVRLGPDTADLKMRFGAHSGPVIGGVLRGERSRFQLFGDTVNTCARIENTGVINQIHASESTAALLQAAGYGHWVTPRTDRVHAKGKGILKTYWVCSDPDRSEIQIEPNQKNNGSKELSEIKQQRLVDWMTELLVEHTRKIHAHNQQRTSHLAQRSAPFFQKEQHKTFIDEIAPIIELPGFNDSVAKKNLHPSAIPEEVSALLRELVVKIASLYHRDVPFHNFEHCSHVTLAVDKFLKRIVAPNLTMTQQSGGFTTASKLHEYTHGINSDPLAHFAIVFSAAIHDIDHRGISNSQLCKEDEAMANLYRGQSVAEQNSLDLAWNLLMQDQFGLLRKFLFDDQSDLMRFRQIIVNLVLATDLFDKELNDLRKSRWEAAFGEDSEQNPLHNGYRATIVLEHIIQASDVIHTMQHWHVYRKWNKRLFHEMFLAFKSGRMSVDPSTFWYQGEMDFFDNYIIPLAKKLKECNVFGVSSDECLDFALLNRAEWEEKGERIVDKMMSEVAAEVHRHDTEE